MASKYAPAYADVDSDMDAEMDAEVSVVPWTRATGIALVVWSALGLTAAFALSVDKVRILEDPTYQPSCNLNPVLSCGSVMITDQAQAFGFPNPFLGLVGFSVMLTIGVLVASSVRLPRLVVLGGAVGALAGAVFVHWLVFQSLYRIGALCPWCMVVWAVTIPLATWFVVRAVAELPGAGARRLASAVWGWRFTFVALWYVAVVTLALIQFWDYWVTLV